LTSVKLAFPVGELARHAARYSYDDDGPVLAIGRAARERGWYTEREFVDTCRWKTARSQPLIVQNTAAEVATATRTALADDAEERERIEALRSLSGVDWATASVLLHLALPDTYPIWDVRALQAFGIRGRFAPSFKRWELYVGCYRQLVAKSGLDGRTVDKGLWQWSVD
jgi:hypothetical protein